MVCAKVTSEMLVDALGVRAILAVNDAEEIHLTAAVPEQPPGAHCLGVRSGPRGSAPKGIVEFRRPVNAEAN